MEMVVMWQEENYVTRSLSNELVKSVFLKQPGGWLEVLGSFFQTGHTFPFGSDGYPLRGLRVGPGFLSASPVGDPCVKSGQSLMGKPGVQTMRRRGG